MIAWHILGVLNMSSLQNLAFEKEYNVQVTSNNSNVQGLGNPTSLNVLRTSFLFVMLMSKQVVGGYYLGVMLKGTSKE